MDIRPLTRSKKDGTLYYRDALVEEQIRSMASLPDEEIIAHAQIPDTDNPQHIHAESVVYWIREYLHRGDRERAGELAGILLPRCTKRIQPKLRSLGPDAAREAGQDVVSELFSEIFNLENDHADFLQARFWRALEVKIINAFNKYIRNDQRTRSLSAQKGQELYDNDVAEGTELPDPTTTEQLIEDRDLLNRALATIDEPFRQAFMMHYHGWPIESKESGVLTISSHFKREPRTIRNWLRRAEQALSEWKDKERL